MRPLVDSQKTNRHVHIYVTETTDIELLQSAEIVSRELKSRGFNVGNSAAKSRATDCWAQIRMSGEALREGKVELSTAQCERRVPLEDVVDQLQEMYDAKQN